LYADSAAKPTTFSVPSIVATTAENAPDRSASQLRWSSSERGTRSKVLV
jgi:hypothetical protein